MEHRKKSSENLQNDSIHQNNDHSNFVSMARNNPIKSDTDHEVKKEDNHKSETPESDTVAKLQKQNEKLRSELRELNLQLKILLDKKKNVLAVKQTASQDSSKVEELKKELDNAQKQLQIYVRDVKSLQAKLGYAHNSDRIQDLESSLHQKEKEIQKLVAEKKVYEKISRNQEKKLNNQNFEAEANSYREEIRLLKQKLRDMEEKEKNFEKNDQKKHEYYLKIEEKYREVCQKYGIDGSNEGNKTATKPSRTQQQNSKSLLNGKNEIKGKPGSNKSSDDNETIELTEAKSRELQNTIKILKKAHFSNEKRYKMEAEIWQNRIKELEAENKELAIKLRDKEKEANIMSSKISEMKRTFKRTLLSPIANYTPHKEDTNKTPLALKHHKLPGIGGMRKEEKGKAVGNVQIFTDQELFKDKTDWKITGFTVWLNSKGVAGLKAFYSDSNGEVIEGNKNVSDTGIAGYHSQDVRFSYGDFLKELSGTFDKSETFIQSISFLTSGGETHQVGNPEPPGKPFKFDINEYEYPAVIFGAFEIEYDEQDGEKKETGSSLTKIGLLVKSDSVEEHIQPETDQKKGNSNKLLTKSTDLKISNTQSPRHV